MGKIAFVFSGQGAQVPGMGKDLQEISKAAREVFERADQVRPGTTRQCFEGSREELGETINTQPCVFAVDLAAARAVEERGIHPDCVAGFSLGEIAAVGFSGMLTDQQAFELVCARAKLMEEAAQNNKGAMAAVLKLDSAQVEKLCESYEHAWPVNYNCPKQTVAAASIQVIDSLCADVKQAGGKAVKLAVSGAFHSPYMESAADGLEQYLRDIPLNQPQIPVYANATALPYGENGKELLCRQCKSPVLWQKTIENMVADGVDTFIEVGVGKTLTGLIKKTAPEAQAFKVENKEDLDAVAAALGV
ncbi:MAG: ACP S-malonyltransferase [Clostridiales bacterium]|nr:ACP S-malonyltransferase [Clostridiales bacterium]